MWANTCEECGQRYERNGPRTRFCSRKCSQAVQRRRPRPPKRTQGEIACAACGKPFVGQNVSFKSRPMQVYCSQACYNAVRVKRPTLVCAQCGRTCERKKNPGSGGVKYNARYCSKQCANDAQRTGFIDKNGYRGLTIKGRVVMEHRLVIEQHLGRLLLPSEYVHHRNGQRADNRLSNLELWDRSQPPGQRVADKIAWCLEFLTRHRFPVVR